MVGREKGVRWLQGWDGGEGGLSPLHDRQLWDNNAVAAFEEMLARGGTTMENSPPPPLSIALHMALALGGPSGPPLRGATNTTGGGGAVAAE
jgi:hypothetical protein